MSARILAFITIAACYGLMAHSTVHAAGAQTASPQNLASSDWSIKASPNLATNPPSLKVIERFTRSIENSAFGESFLGDRGGTEICSFKFANLRNDGLLSLVVGIGVTERPGCGNVYIIDKAKTARGFQLFQSGGGSDAGSDIPGSLKELRKAGKCEFLIENTLGVLTGRCAAGWTAIYAWTGANYTNVSDQFKDFYRQRLSSITKTMATLGTEPGPDGYSRRDEPCLAAEAAMIQRFLGTSADAGMDQMATLANSKDPFEREFAADILGSFGDAKAHEYLEKLSEDPNKVVKLYAQNSLSRLSKAGKYPNPPAADSFQGPY